MHINILPISSRIHSTSSSLSLTPSFPHTQAQTDPPLTQE